MGGMQRRLLQMVAVAGIAVVGAACSTTPKTSGPPAPPAADTRLALAELLAPSQGPPGWSSADDQNTALQGHANTQLAGCEHAATPGGAPPATAQAPSWTSSQGASITDQTEVFPTAGEARADGALYSNPAAPQCLQSTYAKQIEAEVAAERSHGASLGAVTATFRTVPLDTTGVDAAAAGATLTDVEVILPVTEPGQGTLDAYVDECIVQKGRSETQIVYTQLGSQPDAGIIATLASAAATKMQ
jgi:hypothetical protein